MCQDPLEEGLGFDQLAVTQASLRPLELQNMVWIFSTAFISSSALA